MEYVKEKHNLGEWGEWKAALAYLYRISKGQRKRILITCMAGIAEAIFSLAFVYASKLIIDIATGSPPAFGGKQDFGLFFFLS